MIGKQIIITGILALALNLGSVIADKSNEISSVAKLLVGLQKTGEKRCVIRAFKKLPSEEKELFVDKYNAVLTNIKSGYVRGDIINAIKDIPETYRMNFIESSTKYLDKHSVELHFQVAYIPLAALFYKDLQSFEKKLDEIIEIFNNNYKDSTLLWSISYFHKKGHNIDLFINKKFGEIRKNIQIYDQWKYFIEELSLFPTQEIGEVVDFIATIQVPFKGHYHYKQLLQVMRSIPYKNRKKILDSSIELLKHVRHPGEAADIIKDLL